jgi:hypothetical protein
MSSDVNPKNFAKDELTRLQRMCSVRDKSTFDRHQLMIDAWDSEIRSIASTMKAPVPQNCAAGVLPLSEINAVAQRSQSPAGEIFVIGINEGLFYFVEGMAKICALYFSFSSGSVAALAKDSRGCKLFARLLHSMTGFADREPYADLKIPQERVEFAESMASLMPFYVAAHEYAHVMRGHHNQLSLSRRKTPAGEYLELDEIPLSQKLEFDADLTGLMTTLAAADTRGHRLALSLWAADFYFVAVSFWERFIPGVVIPIAAVLKDAARRNGIDVIMPRSLPPAGTHPPTSVRRSMVRAAMICGTQGISSQDLTIEDALRIKPPPNTELAAAYGMADQSEEFMWTLWQCAKADFSGLVEAGLKSRKAY